MSNRRSSWPAVACLVVVFTSHADPAAVGTSGRVLVHGVADRSGAVRANVRQFDPAASVTVEATGDGRVVAASVHPDARRVIVEFKSRPLPQTAALDTALRGSSEHHKLASDLAVKHFGGETEITHEYRIVFNGTAAVLTPSALEYVRHLDYVAEVHPDLPVHATLTESVPLTGAPAIWSTHHATGAGVRVAIIDTGIDYTHPDLGGCFGTGCKVSGGYDFVNGDADPSDDNGHGTHVAGIVAANGRLKGMAPDATLLAYKVLDGTGRGLTSDIVAALERAVMDGARVANLSLGGEGYPDDPASKAIDNATTLGLLSVVAAGNSGPSYYTIQSPGTARTALTVGATNHSDQIADFSSRGYVSDPTGFAMKPELLAPGVAIESTVPLQGEHGTTSRYARLSGTSMATPHVAGAAALLIQGKPTETAGDLKRRLVHAARGLDSDPFTAGSGRLDALASWTLPVLASVTHIDFGVVDEPGVASRQMTLSVRNASTATRTFTVTAPGALPPGTSLEITPSTDNIAPNESRDVSVLLKVDGALTPESATEPLVYHAALEIQADGLAAVVPLYFFKANLVTLTFDRAPGLVTIISPGLRTVRRTRQAQTEFRTVVRRGTWDIIAAFDRHDDVPEVEDAFVIRETQRIDQSVSISLSSNEAIHGIACAALNERFAPLDESYRGTRYFGVGLRSDSEPNRYVYAIFGFAASTRFRTSTLSPRYAVAIGCQYVNRSNQDFFYSWTGAGVGGAVTLPIAGLEMRRILRRATLGTGLSALWVGGGGGIAIGASNELGLTIAGNEGAPVEAAIEAGPRAVAESTTHVQSVSAPDLPFALIMPSFTRGFDGARNVVYETAGPYVRWRSFGGFELDRSGFFNLLNSSRAADLTLAEHGATLHIDSMPFSLPLRFRNSASGLMIDGRDSLVSPAWTSSSFARIALVRGSPPVLDVTRDGISLGMYALYPVAAPLTVPSPPGVHELRSTYSYEIGGMTGTADLIAVFDTRKADPNPPFVEDFHIEQNVVKFNVTDDVSLSEITCQWRRRGTDAWIGIPLSAAGAVRAGVLPESGAIDLRLTVRDSSGNSLVQQWQPVAVITPSRRRAVRK